MSVKFIIFLKWSQNFTEFSEFVEFRESKKFTEAWIGLSLKILSVTCVFTALWYHRCLLCKRLWVRDSLFCQNFCQWIHWIQWKSFRKNWLTNFLFSRRQMPLYVLDIFKNTDPKLHNNNHNHDSYSNYFPIDAETLSTRSILLLFPLGSCLLHFIMSHNWFLKLLRNVT